MNKFNKKADFTGYSTDTKEIGEEFCKTVGKQNVLFPQAKASLRTVQQQFENASQAIELVVYETFQKRNITVEDSDIVVFTSPSNVEAYFGNLKLNASQKIIAIGKSTEKKLNEYGITNCILPESLGELGLAEAVFGSPS